MNNPIIHLQSVHKHFMQGDNLLEILVDVNLSIAPGELVALVGPSGSGKTTLLQIAGLLDVPTSGEAIISGKRTSELSEHKRTLIRRYDLGFVYQFHHLISEFTALENVMLPLRIAGGKPKDIKETAVQILTELGLSDRMDHTPGQLSGGQQQRVAIARAMVHKPALILADEPTGNLDPHTAEDVFETFIKASRDHNLSALIVTHNQTLAEKLDRRVTLHNGRLEELNS
ncbi:MAG: ABC transporter ATP-binding protein [Alphaproteobacteria bacterium]|nr:ABC transporter ATP-binding protein [Alphaproteobacteria bacterium]